jgi:hypothetical protein
MLKPLTMFGLLLGVFGFILGADPGYRLNLIIGLFLYDFFAESTKVGVTSLHARGFLLTHARCPSWILIVTSLSNPLITLIVFSAAMAGFLAVSGRPPGLIALAAYGAYAAPLVAIVTVIELGSVSKAFWLPAMRRETVREHVLGARRRKRDERLQVLDSVSFAVEPGEAVAIMGRNGILLEGGRIVMTMPRRGLRNGM